MYKETVKVVELILEVGSKHIFSGVEFAVQRAWGTYPVVSSKWPGEAQLMQRVEYEAQDR